MPALRDHADWVPWTKRDLRLHVDLLTGYQSELPLLTESRQDEHAFHPREGLADALTPAASKRKVGELLAACLLLRQ